MKQYQVIISKVAGKELRQFPKDAVGKIYAKMMSLSDNPPPSRMYKIRRLQ